MLAGISYSMTVALMYPIHRSIRERTARAAAAAAPPAGAGGGVSATA